MPLIDFFCRSPRAGSGMEDQTATTASQESSPALADGGVDDSSFTVWFQFRGSGGEDETKTATTATTTTSNSDVATIIPVPKKYLDAKKESFLSKLVEETWNTSFDHDDDVGKTVDNPITVVPPTETEWNAKMACLVEEAYKYHYAMSVRTNGTIGDIHKGKNGKTSGSSTNTNGGSTKNGEKDIISSPSDCKKSLPRLALPDGVELEDALAVLESFGLAIVEDLSRVISFDNVSKVIHIRAKLFLQEINQKCESTRDIILQHILDHPKRLTYFVFLGHHHDDSGTDVWDGIIAPGRNKIRELIRVGNVTPSGNDNDEKENELKDCNHHADLVEHLRHRETIISLLQREGLKAEFLRGDHQEEGFLALRPKADYDYMIQNYDTNPAKCFLAYKETEQRGEDVLQAFVLQVEVPHTHSNTKRRRLNSLN